jgi:hypothetical protein
MEQLSRCDDLSLPRMIFSHNRGDDVKRDSWGQVYLHGKHTINLYRDVFGFDQNRDDSSSTEPRGMLTLDDMNYL